MTQNLAFPWAAQLDADQLEAFIEDLWGAASGNNDLDTLAAIEKVIAEHGPDPVPQRPCPLTGPEVDALTCIANGATYETAARQLGVTTATLRRQIEQAYFRLGAHNAAHASAVAARQGWLPDLRMPDLPPKVTRRGAHAWRALYFEATAEMRAHPGQPFQIGPYGACSGARNAAWRMQRGMPEMFQPARSFKAKAKCADDGHWYVTARYVGTTSDQPKKETP